MSGNQKRFKTGKTRAFCIAMLLIVGFVDGIPMIVFGAVDGITALLVIGIILTVLGFYGAPVAWVQYSNQSMHGAVLAAIEDEGLGSVSAIAAHLGKNEKNIRAGVDYLISHGCLKGYVLDAEGGISRSAPKQGDYIDLGKCPNCNASLVLREGEIGCPYCGTVVRSKDK